ncbi:MAG: tetratricopeptide repeat protein [Candidatus Thiodiazotropha sp. (ex Monitilora ramsayi)]|nr:tetratricopeptide repeat protein [Candidatus Thiodiazotropha sp. (ex Monitilora ramsayi)]
MKRTLSLALTTSLVSGCATFMGSDSDEPTLANLEKREIVIEKKQLSATDREEVIENYQALLKLNPDRRLSSEATRRLADLQLEQSETQLLQSEETVNASAAELDKSIQLYEQLLEKEPNYPSRDLVLYQLARANELQGDLDKMMAALDELVAKHPDSQHWQEAQFRRGERFFVQQRFDQAENAYAAILAQRDDSPYYDRALLKHGWSRFKRQNIEQGLDSFTLLLDRKLGETPQINLSELSPADQALLNETLRIISLTFSELGGTRRISSYFDQKGHRNYEYLVYQGLGDLYLKQERIQDAADAYLAFVDFNPVHPQSPRLAVKVVDIYTKNGFSTQALESKKSFTQRYAVHSEYRQQLNEADRNWLNGQLRLYLKELAEYHHALAQQSAKLKTKEAATVQAREGREAARWYRLYLDSFPEDPTAGSISFLLAELLFELQQYPEAVVAYEESAYKLPKHDKRAEAGYAALLAYDAEEKRLPKEARAAWRKRSVESALRFSSVFPNDPRMAQVLTQAAERLLEMNDFGRARGAALQVVNLDPPAKKALLSTAWIVAAHAAFEQQDFAAAETGYQQALALMPKRDEQRPPLEEKLAASIYQQGASLREQGDNPGAARQFLRIATLVPKASIRATAEYDAAASLIAGGDWDGSVAILESFRKRYPDNELIAEVNNKLATAYLETKQPLKAAAELSTISEQGSTPELRQAAGWQSAELYEKAGRVPEAINAYSRYVKAFPTPIDQSIEARQKLVDLYEQQGNPKQRDHWLKQIVEADAGAGKLRSDRTRYLAAHASLRLARPDHELFNRIALKAPLEKNLKRKKTQMQSAITAYKQAAEYGVAEVSTAATYHIGEIYQQFGAALLDSERPKGLNEEELEQYEILLEEQAYPFEDKAIAIYESNIKHTASGIYDEWIKKSFKALAKLQPARYAKKEQSEEWVDAIN